jgi:hypothetical protein
MSLSDKHTIHQEFYEFGPINVVSKYQYLDKSKESDTLSIYGNKVNGWYVICNVNQYGKVTMIGEKTMGSIGKSGPGSDEAKIKFF